MSTVAVPPPRAPIPASVASRFALLADPLRLRIVEALAREQLCTCHLVEITGARQTAISNHLRLLREAGVVESEPEGRYTWYRIAPGAFAEALRALGDLTADNVPPRLRAACAPASPAGVRP